MKTLTVTDRVDYKDTELLIKSIQDSLKEMGIKMIVNPFNKGCDEHSFIIADEEYYDEELQEMVSDELIYLNDGNEVEEGLFKDTVEKLKNLLM